MQHVPYSSGTMLGKYRIEQTIRSDDESIVYSATDTMLHNRSCIIKQYIIQPDWSKETQEEAQKRFLQETELLIKLNTPGHPNIPEVYDVLNNDCLVMKSIEGITLQQLLDQRGGRLSEAEALLYVRAVCNALVYMHGFTPEPVLHLNIHLQTMVLDDTRRVWLVEIGLRGTTAVSQADTDVVSTKDGQTAFVDYYAPEQRRGAAEPRSDVYSLALTLYTLVTGVQPELRGDEPIRSVRELYPGLSPEVDALIKHASRADATLRPTAQEFLHTLEGIIHPTNATTILSPDGTPLTSTIELTNWCEKNWHEAVSWLYSSLPMQIEHFWKNEQLADDIRTLQQDELDRSAALDILLTRLDPQGFGETPPRTWNDPAEIDYQLIDPKQEEQQTRSLTLMNMGSRHIQVTIAASDWISVNPAVMSLAPLQQMAVVLKAVPEQQHHGKRLQDTLNIQRTTPNGITSSLALPVHADIGLTKTDQERVFLRYAIPVTGGIGLLLTIWSSVLGDSSLWGWVGCFAFLFVFLLGGILVVYIATLRERYSPDEKPLLLVLLGTGRSKKYVRRIDERAEHLYQEILEAIVSQQWDRAVQQIVNLEKLQSGYRDVKTLVSSYPELYAALKDHPLMLNIEGKRFGIRATAYIVDVMIVSLIYFTSTFVYVNMTGRSMMDGFDTLGIHFWSIIGAAEYVLLMMTFSEGLLGAAEYVLMATFFEGLYGATIGKMLFGMRVVKTNGRPCGLKAAFIRALYLGTIETMSFGIVSRLSMRRPLYQRLGDKAAQTVVAAANDVYIKQRPHWVNFIVALLLFILLDTAVNTILSTPPQWQAFTPDNRLSVLVPDRLYRDYRATHGTDSERFTLDWGNARYHILYADLETHFLLPETVPSGFFDALRDGFLAGLAKEDNISSVNLVSEHDITLDDYPGRAITIEAREYGLIPMKVNVRLFLVEDRIYWIYLSQIDFFPVDEKRFLESTTLLDPEESAALETEEPSVLETEESATSWQPFSSEEGGFSVMMPGEPQKSLQKLGNAFVEYDMNIYLAGYNTDGPWYLVGYADYPEQITSQFTPQKILDDEVAAMRNDAKVVRVKDITFDGYPGRELEVESQEDDGSILVKQRQRLYIINNRFYMLQVSWIADGTPQENIDTFMDSFELLEAVATVTPTARPVAETVAAPTAESGEQVEEFQTYTHPSGIFTIDLPESWVVNDQSEAGLVRTFVFDLDGDVSLLINILQDPEVTFSQAELGELVRYFAEQNFGDQPNFSMDDATIPQNDGSVLLTYTFDDPDGNLPDHTMAHSYTQQDGDKISIVTVLQEQTTMTEERDARILDVLVSYTVDISVAVP